MPFGHTTARIIRCAPRWPAAVPRLSVMESAAEAVEETKSNDQSSTVVALKVVSIGLSKGMRGLPPMGTEVLV